jgi:hypothetical protein
MPSSFLQACPFNMNVLKLYLIKHEFVQKLQTMYYDGYFVNCCPNKHAQRLENRVNLNASIHVNKKCAN